MLASASALLGLSNTPGLATEALQLFAVPSSRTRKEKDYTPSYRPKAASRRAYRQLKRYRRIGEFNQEYTQRRRLERVKDTNRKIF